jgi:putative nucleotidyltransferase with HDIG domain
MSIRFSTRVFLLSFFPIALLLGAALVSTQQFIASGVRDGLRTSLHESHNFISRSRAEFDAQNTRLLRIVARNPRLRAGIEAMRQQPIDPLAQEALEGQLMEYGELLGLDFLSAYSPGGVPLATAASDAHGLHAVAPGAVTRDSESLFSIGDTVYVVSELPVSFAYDQIGTLVLGRAFDLAQFSAPIILSRGGKVISSSLQGYTVDEVDRAMAGCGIGRECEVTLGGETMLSLETDDVSLGEQYRLRSIQSVDRAGEPIQAAVRSAFYLCSVLALVALLFVSSAAARSVVSPLTSLTDRIEATPNDGYLPTLMMESGTYEIDRLVQAFNRASTSVRDGRMRLDQAYTEFVASISSAVDARDVYTAGHSRRVSKDSTAIAKFTNLSRRDVEIARTGALLHDVGKIGVPDEVLQKSGPLTREEYELVKQHPSIGKRILENVEAFRDYVPVVELHHENHDGSGYPWGLAGEEIPIAARIVHVADAYDAMVTDRPYRKGLCHAAAIEILRANAGSQFDPQVVNAFVSCATPRQVSSADDSNADESQELQKLAAVLEREEARHRDRVSKASSRKLG